MHRSTTRVARPPKSRPIKDRTQTLYLKQWGYRPPTRSVWAASSICTSVTMIARSTASTTITKCIRSHGATRISTRCVCFRLIFLATAWRLAYAVAIPSLGGRLGFETLNCWMDVRSRRQVQAQAQAQTPTPAPPSIHQLLQPERAILICKVWKILKEVSSRVTSVCIWWILQMQSPL